MTLEQATRWRNWMGRAAACLCALFLLAALDGLIAKFRQTPNEFHLLAGDSVKVNGTLRSSVEDLSQLSHTSNSEDILFSFDATHAGFWMGGAMWRGVVFVSPEAEPGEYRLTVNHKDDPPQKPSSIIVLKVYSDPVSLRMSSRSFIQRTLGISPWTLFAVFFPLTLLAFGLVYLLSQKRERLLAQDGKAEIYRINKGPAHTEIVFGLGTRHGVQPGTALTLLDRSGSPVCSVQVQQAFEDDATASVDLNCTVKPGYMVSRQ